MRPRRTRQQSLLRRARRRLARRCHHRIRPPVGCGNAPATVTGPWMRGPEAVTDDIERRPRRRQDDQAARRHPDPDRGPPPAGAARSSRQMRTPWVCSSMTDSTALGGPQQVARQTTAGSNYHPRTTALSDSPNNVARAVHPAADRAQGKAPVHLQTPSGSYSRSSPALGNTRPVRQPTPYNAREAAGHGSRLQETLCALAGQATKYGTWPLSARSISASFYSSYTGWTSRHSLHYLQSTVSWLTNTNVYTELPRRTTSGHVCSYDRPPSTPTR